MEREEREVKFGDTACAREGRSHLVMGSGVAERERLRWDG